LLLLYLLLRVDDACRVVEVDTLLAAAAAAAEEQGPLA